MVCMVCMPGLAAAQDPAKILWSNFTSLAHTQLAIQSVWGRRMCPSMCFYVLLVIYYVEHIISIHSSQSCGLGGSIYLYNYIMIHQFLEGVLTQIRIQCCIQHYNQPRFKTWPTSVSFYIVPYVEALGGCDQEIRTCRRPQIKDNDIQFEIGLYIYINIIYIYSLLIALEIFLRIERRENLRRMA